MSKLTRLLVGLFLLLGGVQADAQFFQPVQFFPGGGNPCGGPTVDAWSPTWFFDSWFTGGGTTTVQTTVSANGQPAPEIGSIGHITGVYYHEVTVTAASPGDMAWGYAAQAFGNQIKLGTDSGPALSIGYYDSTTHAWVYAAVTAAASGLPSPSSGDVLGLWVDLTNGKTCWRDVTQAPSSWAGGNGLPCDPVTGTNTRVFTPFGVCVYAAFSSNQNGTSQGAIMNMHGPFAAAAPTGSGPWQP